MENTSSLCLIATFIWTTAAVLQCLAGNTMLYAANLVIAATHLALGLAQQQKKPNL